MTITCWMGVWVEERLTGAGVVAALIGIVELRRASALANAVARHFLGVSSFNFIFPPRRKVRVSTYVMVNGESKADEMMVVAFCNKMNAARFMETKN